MDGDQILSRVDQIEKLDRVARRTYGLNDVPTERGLTVNMLLVGGMSELEP